MRSFFIIFILSLLASCGQNAQEKMDEAIDVALTYLTSGKCQEAIDVLSEVPNQNDNGIYLQVLASAHACKANFNQIHFISNDLTRINTSDVSTIMSSIATLTLSPESVADSVNYRSVLTGVNLILNSTTGFPSQTERKNKFGERRAGDMGILALVLNVVNLGKFLNFYGNVNSNGEKGLGSNTNQCFINYTDPRAQGIIGGGAGGICNSTNDGHPDLDHTTAAGRRRMCEGLMTLTNIIDIMDHLDLTGDTELNRLQEIADRINSVKADVEAAGLGTLINMTSQTACEQELATSTLDMQYLYSLVFETGLQ